MFCCLAQVFAAGAYVMHMVFRTKYQEYADAQIEDVRDHYRKKEADLDTMIEEKAQQKSMEQLTGKVPHRVRPGRCCNPRSH